MTRLPSLLAAVLAAAACAAAAGAAGAGAAVGGVPRSSGSAWLGTGIVTAPGGPFLRDSEGRALEMHGVNLVAKCGGGGVPSATLGSPCVGPVGGRHLAYVLSPTAQDPGRRLTAQDAATLARLGFDVVRLGIVWEGLEPGPRGVGPNDPRYCSPHAPGTPFPVLGSADPYRAATLAAYLRRTDRIVSLLAAAGIRVILDMHQDGYGSAFSHAGGTTPWNAEGAPPWATCTSGQPDTSPTYWNASYGDPAVIAAIHNFMSNDVSGDLQGQFVRVWRAVARHYRANPDVVGYELYNEPTDFAARYQVDHELQCDYGGTAREPVSCASSGAQALPGGWIGAIQAVDPRHVIFYEPDVGTDFGAGETIGITEPLRYRRLALAFHAYGDNATILPLVAGERARTRTEQPGGPPWILDEFGSSRATAGTAGTVGLASAGNLSWSYWAALQLHDPTGSPFEALIDTRTRRPYPAKALALAVPYPAATSGAPGAQSFARGRRIFRYRYRPSRRIAAPTEIVVPRYTYPHGYRVAVQGASVVSLRGAPLLLLAKHRRARIVTVTVRPSGS